MGDAWIIDAVRTPRGKGKKETGALANVHPVRSGADGRFRPAPATPARSRGRAPRHSRAPCVPWVADPRAGTLAGLERGYDLMKAINLGQRMGARACLHMGSGAGQLSLDEENIG